MMEMARIVVVVLCVVVPLVVTAGEREDQAFAQLKGLAGTWDAVTPNGPQTIVYRIASAGSIVIEEMYPGTEHEMITVYHRDGEKLVATHYCAAGNQPRTALDATRPLSEGLHFAFAGGTNMKVEDGHIHEWTIRIADAGHVEERWTYWEDGKEQHVTTFTMTRRAAQPASQEPRTGAVADLGIVRSAVPAPVDAVSSVKPLFRDGRVFIAGQPSREALAQLHALGVTAVVNLRTPAEMEDRERVPYDEAAAAAELGMEYVWIPLGGEGHPYTPQAVDRFAKALADHPGPVLLHCTVGWRASYMWVAYLVREQGFALPDALARGEAMALSPDPLEGLLGRGLTVQYADEPQP